MPKLARRAEPEYGLKHRITGAIILVTAAVLIVPLLLSGHRPPGPDSASDTSSPPGSSNRFRTIPLNLGGAMGQVPEDDGGSLSDSSVEVGNITEEDRPATGNSSDFRPTQEPVPVDRNDPLKPAVVMTRIPAQSQDLPAATVPSREPERSRNEAGWFVRVGTYAQQNNVDFMADLLKKNGYQPRMKSVMTLQGQSTRIWLGPYVKRDAADSVSERLRELTGEKGYVTGDNS